MIEIKKYGVKHETYYGGSCSKCLCDFTISDEDIKFITEYKVNDVEYGEITKRKIKCPCCYEDVMLQSYFNEKTLSVDIEKYKKIITENIEKNKDVIDNG